MGSEKLLPGRAPQHQAHVDGFWIDRYVVMVGEFAAGLAPDEDACAPKGDTSTKTRIALLFVLRVGVTDPSGPRDGRSGCRRC